MAEENNQTETECLNKPAEMYDGYHFSKKSDGVYNPFSLLNAFYNNEYGKYWFSTGTPTFLINKLENSDYTVERMTDGVEASVSELTDYRVDDINPIPLFYQSGYLTIQNYDSNFGIYTLSFPNEEVRYGFLDSLIPSVLGNRNTEQVTLLKNMALDLRSADVSSFFKQLSSIFVGIPYTEGDHHPYEQEWRNEVYLILSLMGQNAKCEVHTARGRADCIVETKDYVYIFEYKVDHSAEEALKQIEEKGYAEPYKTDRRTVYEIGVNFSSEKRNIGEWKAAEIL